MGVSRQPMILSNVDFPIPDSPVIATISPWSMSIEHSGSMVMVVIFFYLFSYVTNLYNLWQFGFPHQVHL